MQLAQHEDFAATLRQRLNCLREKREFLILRDSIDCIWPIIQDAQLVHFCYTLDRDDFLVAEEIKSRIARRCIQIGLGMANLACGLRPDEAQIGFLYNIVEIGQRRKPHAQPSA